MYNYLSEAFEDIEKLEDASFDLNSEGARDLKDYLDNDEDIDDNMQVVIDPEANTYEDIKDSYIGDIILNCPICQSKIYKSIIDIKLCDDKTCANEGEECPYCHSTDGFEIIGKVVAFKPDTDLDIDDDINTDDDIDIEADSTFSSDEDIDDISDIEDISDLNDVTLDRRKPYDDSDTLTESSKRISNFDKVMSNIDADDYDDDSDTTLTESSDGTSNYDKIMNVIYDGNYDDYDDYEDDYDDGYEPITESFNNVSVETDDAKLNMKSDASGKVTITSEPIDSIGLDTTDSDIDITIDSDNIEDSDNMIAPIDDEEEAEIIDNTEKEDNDSEDSYEDVDIDEFDEDEFDNLGESYLKKVYNNVDSYKTTSGSIVGNNIILEGLIKFKSGKSRKTKFVFEGKEITKKGKIRLIGENLSLTKNKKAFSLVGSVQKKKLVIESFRYNYLGKDSITNKSQRVYGTIKR